MKLIYISENKQKHNFLQSHVHQTRKSVFAKVNIDKLNLSYFFFSLSSLKFSSIAAAVTKRNFRCSVQFRTMQQLS